jgi:hypothetical protein
MNELIEYIEKNNNIIRVNSFYEEDFICPDCKSHDAAFFHCKNNVGDVIKYGWCIPCKTELKKIGMR